MRFGFGQFLFIGGSSNREEAIQTNGVDTTVLIDPMGKVLFTCHEGRGMLELCSDQPSVCTLLGNLVVAPEQVNCDMSKGWFASRLSKQEVKEQL